MLDHLVRLADIGDPLTEQVDTAAVALGQQPIGDAQGLGAAASGDVARGRPPRDRLPGR